jgi:predicted RNase H-like HicB family nuclease
MTYRVKITWDDEARAWIAASDDLRGLILESGSIDALIERVKAAVPELLELNGAGEEGILLDFSMERQSAVV